MKQILMCCVFLACAGCVHFESNPIPPSVELSPEQLELDFAHADSERTTVDFGVEARINESDSFANIEVLPGLKVITVNPNSPADFAGIVVNDVILSIDGVETNSTDTLETIAEQSSPDQSLLFEIRRGTAVLEATLIARQAKQSIALRELYRIDPIATRAAYRTEIVQLAGGQHTSAARVIQLSENSPLHAAGFQEGDVITAIDSEEVQSAQQLVTKLVEEYSPGSKVTLSTFSNGRTFDRGVNLWNPGRYLARLRLWPLFRYEFRPDPRKTILQFPELIPLYRYHTTDLETNHRFLWFFNIRSTRIRRDESTNP